MVTWLAAGGIHSAMMRNNAWANWGAWRHIFYNLILHAATFLLFAAASVPWVRRIVGVADSVVMLLAAMITGLLAYAIFFVFLWGTGIGCAAVVLSYAAALLLCAAAWRKYRRDLWSILGGWDSVCAVGLTGMAAVFYLAILYLHQSSAGFSGLAADGLVGWELPGDNRINQDVATGLIEGKPIRIVQNIWHSSDRPPLETGVEILGAFRLGEWNGQAGNYAMPLAGILLQSTWVLGVWAVLRMWKLERREAAWICLALIPNGFFYVNTLYIWPKLCAGAFSLGAYVVLLTNRTCKVGDGVLAGAFIAAAMLSHGGAIFFLVPMGIVVLVRWHRWRAAMWAALVAAALYAPWVCYQKYYDPPGDQLLKMHIAGAAQNDPRGMGQIIKDNYGQLGWQGAIENKWANLRVLFVGDWKDFFRFDQNSIAGKRREIFFYVMRSAGLWNLGWAAMVVLLFQRSSREIIDSLLVVGGTFAFWCAAMFGPEATVIHQGAYAAETLMIVVMAYSLLRVSEVGFAVVAIINAGIFLGDYLPIVGNAKSMFGRVDSVAVALLIGCMAMACAAVGFLGKTEKTVG